MPRNRLHFPIDQTTESLRREALSSSDAVVIEVALRSLLFSDAPLPERATAVKEIAEAHRDKTNVMVLALDRLPSLDPIGFRDLCYSIIDGPYDEDRDVIVSRAALSILKLESQTRDDLDHLTKALQHPLGSVRQSMLRGLRNVLPSEVAALHSSINQLPETPALLRILNLIPPKGSFVELTLPARPAEIDVKGYAI